MRQLFQSLCFFFGLLLIAASPSAAGNMGGGSHGGHGVGHGGPEHADHGMGQVGERIHSAKVDGYDLTYEIIDMRKRMKNMPNAPEMAGTHHLMVYVEAQGGKPAENAKAGYLIEGPGGEKQTAMCVGMGGGYGADVNLSQKGAYTIKTKIVNGEDKILDSFIYEVN